VGPPGAIWAFWTEPGGLAETPGCQVLRARSAALPRLTLSQTAPDASINVSGCRLHGAQLQRLAKQPAPAPVETAAGPRRVATAASSDDGKEVRPAVNQVSLRCSVVGVGPCGRGPFLVLAHFARTLVLQVAYSKEFGYSRKDVILIGVGLIGLGYAMYYGLQALGMEAGYAGNWVQLIVFLGICVGWVSTYIFRVATKASRVALSWAARCVHFLIHVCAEQDWLHSACWTARVASKPPLRLSLPVPGLLTVQQMTYVKQLEQYEEAVMRKRVEEMTEAELAQLAAEAETDRLKRPRAPPTQPPVPPQ
jgi:hypothetical protein